MQVRSVALRAVKTAHNRRYEFRVHNLANFNEIVPVGFVFVHILIFAFIDNSGLHCAAVCYRSTVIPR